LTERNVRLSNLLISSCVFS